MTTQRLTRTRWPKGAWMKLQSKDTLKALIKQRGLSYAELADAVKVSKGFISHLTAGRKTTCTPRVAERISLFLDVPLTVLFVPSVPTSASQNVTERMAA